MESLTSIQSKWRSRWTSVLLEPFILHMIQQKERFGGELVKLSQEILDPNTKIPTIYAILRRNTEIGIIHVKNAKSEDGITRGTSRKYYSLTTFGIEYYKNLMEAIDSTIPSIFENSNEGAK